MTIAYSGYNGVDGKYGFEYIKIEGEVKRDLIMKAFGFKAGQAKVKYQWGYSRTTCCLGILPCWDETKNPPAPFSFSASVGKDQTAWIGSIPVGKADLRVTLTAEEDVDVQLYDESAVATLACPGIGKPIIAYSPKEGECNQGPLGNNDGSPEETTYEDVKYGYSGYEGVGGVKGNEFLQLTGVTNRPLKMGAFGFAAGTFNVEYEYYEVPPEGEVPNTPSVHWLATKNNKNNEISFSDTPQDLLIVRRGQGFEFLIFGGASASLTKEMVTVTITGQYATESYAGDPREYKDNLVDRRTSPYKSSIDQTTQEYPSDAYAVTFENDANNRLLVKVSFTTSAPVGEYDIKVKLSIPGNEGGRGRTSPAIEGESTGKFIVLFNPYDSSDSVYTTESNRKEYIENDKGLVWQGLSDNNNGFQWSFNQWEFDNLQIAYDRLFRMPIVDRADPVLVSRHITYSVGADVCYGKWGEGSYTTGRPGGGYTCSNKESCKAGTAEDVVGGWGDLTCNTCTTPDDWRDSTNLFRVHRTVKKPVQYCQCFVYAAITTTIGRALGIPTRPVTTFQSAHDTDKNRAIEKFYSIDPANGEFVPLKDAPTADSVWSFHVWNEMYFKRPEFDVEACKAMGFSTSKSKKGCANGWQAVDATPQESSMGGSGVNPEEAHMQMGPASINLIKMNKDPICPLGNKEKYGCFDNEFVLSEVNSNVNMWLKTDKEEEMYHPGLGFKLYGNTGFMSDPWGDVYNTVGLQISTKKKGEISADCLKEEEKDCSKELDDITKYYKSKEDSGPGIPTMDGKAMKGTDNNPTDNYYYPDVSAEGHRRLFSGRNLDATDDSAAASGIKGPGSTTVAGDILAMGTWPGKANDPIANEPSNPYSSLFIDFPFKNDGDAQQVVYCNYKAYVSDYAGFNMTEVDTGNETLTLEAGAEGSCGFHTHRSSWYLHASTFMDNAINSDVPIMDKNKIAYMMKFEVTATVDSSKELFVGQRIKKIANVIKTLADNYIFDGGYGKVNAKATFAVAREKVEETCAATGDSSKLGDSFTLISNGRCDDDLNNAANCYDGGDCCQVSCNAFWGGHAELDENSKTYAFCSDLVSNQDPNTKCIDPNYKDYTPPVSSYDRQSPAEILGNPVAFDDSGGAADFGFDICRSVYDQEGNVIGSVGLVDDMIDNHFGTGNACETDAESDECKALLDTLLCDTDGYARALQDCEKELLDAEQVGLTTENIPRCKARTFSGCLCKSTYTDGSDPPLEMTGRSCVQPNDGSTAWCDVVEGSCNGNGRSPYDTDAYNDDPRWDYCDAPTDVDMSVEWTPEMEEEFFPELFLENSAVTQRVVAMTIAAAPEAPTYHCPDGQLLDERTKECSDVVTPGPSCGAGEGLVDGSCKTVCDAGRRFLDETTDGGGCVTMADSPDDCGGTKERIEVQAAIDFAGFESENLPTEGSPAYDDFKASVAEGLAKTLGLAKEKVQVVAMSLGAGRRRTTRRLSTTTLRVIFNVVMESSDAAAVVKAEVETKLTAGQSDGSLIANIEEVSNDGDWTGVTVENVTMEKEEEGGGEEEEVEEEEVEEEGDTGDALGKHGGDLMTIAGGCGVIAGAGVVGWLVSAFIFRSERGSSGGGLLDGRTKSDDFGMDKGRNSML